MGFFSGRDGSLYVGTAQVARVGNWSLSSNVETLDVTDLGSVAREFTPGLKASTGSASIFYYDDAPTSLLSKVIKKGAATDEDMVRLSLRWGTKRVDVNAFINQGEVTCQTGEVMQAQISFTVTGDYVTTTV
jgi:hypothetical protein